MNEACIQLASKKFALAKVAWGKLQLSKVVLEIVAPSKLDGRNFIAAVLMGGVRAWFLLGD